MITLLTSFSAQIVPLTDSLGDDKLIRSFSAQVVEMTDSLGDNKVIESSSFGLQHIKEWSKIIRYK